MILSPLDFLAEFTQHTPSKGAHLVLYYGWYSNKTRGMRRKAAAEAAASTLPYPTGRGEGGDYLPSRVLGRGAGGEGTNDRSPARRASQTWAMLTKRVYEIDP